MKMGTMSNRVYTYQELEDLLKDYDPASLFKIFSKNLSTLYNKNYQEYLNTIQMIPALCNSILMYSKGSKNEFDVSKFIELRKMVTSLEHGTDKKDDTYVSIYRTYIKVNRHFDYVPYVLGRLSYIFDDIMEKEPSLSFGSVTTIELDILTLVIVGAYAISLKDGVLAAIAKNDFWDKMNVSEELKRSVWDFIDKELATDINSAKSDLEDNLKKYGQDAFETYSIFEGRPFLKLDEQYLLVAPHFAMNELQSVCSRLFIQSYASKDQNEASKIFGDAFEDYISNLFLDVIKDFDREPPYGDNPGTKGIDIVQVQKGSNKIPFFVEIHKRVVWKSLIYDFSLDAFEKFLDEVVIPKFHQIFKWIKSHNYEYNGVNIIDNLKRAQFIVVMSQDLSVIYLDKPAEIFLEKVNECWKKTTGRDEALKSKNIYLIGCNTLEHLIGVSLKKQIYFKQLLFDFKKYNKMAREFKYSPEDNTFEIRKDLFGWQNSEFPHKDCRYDKLFEYESKLREKQHQYFKEMSDK